MQLPVDVERQAGELGQRGEGAHRVRLGQREPQLGADPSAADRAQIRGAGQLGRVRLDREAQPGT